MQRRNFAAYIISVGLCAWYMESGLDGWFLPRPILSTAEDMSPENTNRIMLQVDFSQPLSTLDVCV